MKRRLAFTCTLLAAALARAGALTDGSVGAVQSLSGAFTVPQSLGAVRGGNLFHSFTRFGIAPGESATFTTSDGGIRHVIARVTGGEASLLQGPLSLQAAAGARPDFVLVNPSGITVAAGARFDVPAGLHLSTAHQVRFADGSTWDTRSAGASSLTVAAPESFGFLGRDAAALRWTDADLTLARGGTLALSAGSITIERARLETADAGARLHAEGALVMGPGAEINLVSAADRPVGDGIVRAGSLHIDGGGGGAGIGSYALGAGPGPALQVEVAGELRLVDGGQLFTAAFAGGDSGALGLRAGALTMDAGASFAFVGTQSLGEASGAAGPLRVDVGGALRMSGASQITTQANAFGPAGRIDLTAGSLLVDGLGLGYTSGVVSRGAGAVQLQVQGDLTLRQGAAISSRSHADHAPQALQVHAARITLDGGEVDTASIGSLTTTAQPSAAVVVDAAERITLGRGGQVNAASLGSGDTGAITVSAPLVELTGGSERVTGILASAYGSERGRAAPLTVRAGTLQVAAGAVIASEAIATGGVAGDILLQADRVVVDGRGVTASVRSIAYGEQGSAGIVRIEAAERLEVLDGGGVIAGSLLSGSAGEIRVATRHLLLDGRDNITYYTGIAGDILTAQGAGATVRVDAGRVELRNGGSISTTTFTDADAGSVHVVADTLLVDGSGTESATGISASSSGAGRAGDVTLVAREIELRHDALVSAAALAAGAGGRISVEATRLLVDNSAGLVSATGGSGNAGDIRVQVAEELRLASGGTISATSAGAGAAGRVDIRAGSLHAAGIDERNGRRTLIGSRASAVSSGQTGSITVAVRDTLTLADGAEISISNGATVDDPSSRRPGTLTLDAGRIVLHGAEVSAASSGNVDAGSIRVTSKGDLRLNDATIRTSALDGNGGAITIDAAAQVRLQDARITTSVDGERNGNGGDITLRAASLVLQSGFVQANTRAPLARGGNVVVDVGVLLPDGSQAFVGGDRIAGYRSGTPGLNVVQAAAPDGVSGTLAVTLPQLDLSGHLSALFVAPIDFGPLGRDICRVGDQSSLTLLGRGALEPPASAPLRFDPR